MVTGWSLVQKMLIRKGAKCCKAIHFGDNHSVGWRLKGDALLGRCALGCVEEIGISPGI